MPYNNYMQGGMFGPLGGSQNMRGVGQLTDRDLQLIASQMGSLGADRDRAVLPNYASQPQQEVHRDRQEFPVSELLG